VDIDRALHHIVIESHGFSLVVSHRGRLTTKGTKYTKVIDLMIENRIHRRDTLHAVFRWNLSSAPLP
jgi:hypothetical protein